MENVNVGRSDVLMVIAKEVGRFIGDGYRQSLEMPFTGTGRWRVGNRECRFGEWCAPCLLPFAVFIGDTRSF